MGNATFVLRECPVCGRRLQIRVEYLGSRISCVHCDGTFTVPMTSDELRPYSKATQPTLMERAEYLLAEDPISAYTPDL
jgi:hypothetical protein